MDDIQKRISQLKLAVEKNDDVTALLESLVSDLTAKLENDAANTSFADAKEMATQLTLLLSPKKCPSVARIAEALADLAKHPRGRSACLESNRELIGHLVALLYEEDLEIVGQACRALGNLCYENDGGRKQALERGALGKLESILYKADKVDGADGHKLRLQASGCLLNLMSTWDEELSKLNAKELAALMLKFLEQEISDEGIRANALLVLGALVDFSLCNHILEDINACRIGNKVMATTESFEVVELCLDLFQSQAENDKVKEQLAKSGTCETLLGMLKKHRPLGSDDESRNVLKMACDLINLILTGDESMEILYGKGDGEVFQELVSWLQDEDLDLKVNGAIAIGNFARNDQHCLQLVEKGVSCKLIEVLKESSGPEGEIRLQHALLSALRNLSIHSTNKGMLTKQGLLDALMPIVAVETFPVVFKLLGTLRMLIDGQDDVANKVGGNPDIVKRIVKWCQTPDFPVVEGEANRLLAWMVKNSKKDVVCSTVIKEKGFTCLVSMATSEHELMQNEALCALLILSRVCATGIQSEIKSSWPAVSGMLSDVLGRKGTAEQVLDNALSLVAIWSESRELQKLLQHEKVLATLKELHTSPHEAIREKVTKLSNSLAAAN